MAPAQPGREAVFRSVYRDHAWKGRSRSGPGSDAAASQPFRAFLEDLIRRHRVGSVLDVGCGDWTSTRLVDWGGVDYMGIDIVPEVIEANRRRYGRAGVRFDAVDFVHADLPDADLLLCKEVLQHLPNADVAALLGRLGAYRLAVLVDDIAGDLRTGWRPPWRWEPVGTTNEDIPPGSWRPLALLEPPFSLAGHVALTYGARHRERRWTKQVLLWTNPVAAPPGPP